jgi:membrane protein DedA with SNARE-associated domain
MGKDRGSQAMHFFSWIHQQITWLFHQIDPDHIWMWIERYGYLGIFGLLFCCGLGLPLPEDIPLLAAGALVAQGKLNLAIVAICAWCGIIGGDCVLYHIGKFFGYEVPRLPVIGHHVTVERMRKVEKLFEKWGIWVVAVGRMFAGIRGAMVVVAGATRFTFWKFLIADGLAAIVSGGLFVYLGYAFGRHIVEIVEVGKHYSLVVVLGITVIVLLVVWWRQKSRGRHRDSAESVEPQTPAANPAPQGD